MINVSHHMGDMIDCGQLEYGNYWEEMITVGLDNSMLFSRQDFL